MNNNIGLKMHKKNTINVSSEWNLFNLSNVWQFKKENSNLSIVNWLYIFIFVVFFLLIYYIDISIILINIYFLSKSLIILLKCIMKF